MGTRLYFDATAAPAITPGFDAGWSDTSEAVRRRLRDFAHRYHDTTAATGSQIGPWSGTAGTKALDRQYLSDPLVAQTISGTIKGQVLPFEIATADNVDDVFTTIKVVSNDGSTVRATLVAFGAYGTRSEFTTLTTGRNTSFLVAQALSSYTCIDGDRLLIEIGYSNSTAGTTPEAAAKWGRGTQGSSDALEANTGTSGNPWIEFSGAVLFQRTRFYFSQDAYATNTPAYNAGWTDTSEAARYHLDTPTDASSSALGTAIGPWSGSAGTKALDRQYVSAPLVAQTLNANFSCVLMPQEVAAEDNVDQMLLAISVVSGDGATVRGTYYALTADATAELPTAAIGRQVANETVPTSSVSVLAGDRLVVEIGYCNSGAGTTPQARSYYGTAANGDVPIINGATSGVWTPWIEFDQIIEIQTSIDYTADLSEAVTLSEALSAVYGATTDLSESNALSEALGALAGFSTSLPEDLSLADALAAQAGFSAAMAEGLSVDEVLAALAGFGASLSEGLTLAEVLAAGLSFTAGLSEGLSLAEQLAASAGFSVSLSEEQLTLLEEMAASRGVTAGLAETITLAEVLRLLWSRPLEIVLQLQSSVLILVGPGTEHEITLGPL